ncbi:MAG: flagellar basal body-associated FliL family protein [Clostridiales bacterium]|nr:flagellar basal body-associated FliL family protein [Clostridiales bacterium]
MKKIIIFGGIALVLIIAAVLVFVFVLGGDDEGKVEDLPEIKYQFEENYTNIPVGDEDGNYKILKYQMTIVYTDEEFTEIFPTKADDITDFLNGYFRDKTLDTINRKNGKERIKEEILEQLIEMLETDADNLKRVLLTQFIIQ